MYPRDAHFYQSHQQKQPIMPTPHLVMSHTRPQHGQRVPHAGMPKLSPKMMTSAKPGSITHGTPMQGNPRYEGMLRQMQSPHKDTGYEQNGDKNFLEILKIS